PEAPAALRTGRWKDVSRLSGILLGAVALRLLFLGTRSFWSDEIVSVKLATDNWGGFWSWLRDREGNMALYYLLLRGWVHVGTSEAWVRSLSVIFGVLSVAAILALVRRLFNERLAWVSASVAGASACMVYFAQEARSYSLLILLCVLSYLC